MLVTPVAAGPMRLNSNAISLVRGKSLDLGWGAVSRTAIE
jgi:hypothetical protein